MNKLVYECMNYYLNKYATYNPGPDVDTFAHNSAQGRLNTELKEKNKQIKKHMPTAAAGLLTGAGIMALGRKSGGGKITNTLAGLGGLYAANKVNKYRNKENK